MKPNGTLSSLSSFVKALKLRVFAVMMMASLLIDLPSHVTSLEEGGRGGGEGGRGQRCSLSPDRAKEELDECLDDFRSFQDNFRLTGSQLFTSADVEVIRTLCSNLQTLLRRLKTLSDRCPSIQYRNQIDSSLRTHLSIIELCDHPSLYEEYAMNQKCFHGQRETSGHCYRLFRAHADRLKGSHGHQFCGYLSDLVLCVRSNFASTCGDASGPVVELLVRAAIDGSHRCRAAPIGGATFTVSPPKTGRATSSQRRSNASSRWQHTTIYVTLSITCSYLWRNRIRTYH